MKQSTGKKMYNKQLCTGWNKRIHLSTGINKTYISKVRNGETYGVPNETIGAIHKELQKEHEMWLATDGVKSKIEEYLEQNRPK